MQVSAKGAVVGALVGAVGRALVVLCWLGDVGLIVALPSAAIGLLVGTIAGALGKPLRGAVVGFVLSAVVFELFMCACASVLGGIGGFGEGRSFLSDVLPYMLLMGLVGAAAGGVGGAVGSTARRPDGTMNVKPLPADEQRSSG